jgi:hypothetical protein
MTYTEAAEHNKQFNLPKTWKDPKAIRDGELHRWFQDPNGHIGFIKNGERHGEVIVHYPTRVLKVNFYLTTKCWKVDELKNFKKLS